MIVCDFCAFLFDVNIAPQKIESNEKGALSDYRAELNNQYLVGILYMLAKMFKCYRKLNTKEFSVLTI